MLNAEIWEAQLVYASNEQLLEWAKSPEWKSVTRYPGRVRDQDGNQIDGSLGDELIRRMQAGRTEEVMALLEQQNPAINIRLNRLGNYGEKSWDKDCPWHGDDQLWFRLSEVMAPLGYLPSSTDEWPARSPELTEQAKVWFTQYMEQLANRQEDGSLTNDADSYKGDIARSSIKLMYYPDMTANRCWEILKWLDECISGTGIGLSRFDTNEWKKMIVPLPLDDRIRLAREQSEKLAYDIVKVSSHDYRKNPDLWDPWIDYFTEFPERCEDHHINNDRLVELYWPYASDKHREDLVRFLVEVIDKKRGKPGMPKAVALFDRLLLECPTVFTAILEDDRWFTESTKGQLALHVFENKYLDLMRPVLVAMTAIDKYSRWDERCYLGILKRIADEYPHLIAKLTGNQLAGLLTRFDATTLNQVLPQITSVVKRGCPKSLLNSLLSISDQLTLTRIEECGWLTKPGKRLTPLVTEVLLARTELEVIPLLQTFLAKGEMDPGTASRVEEKLQALGVQPLSGSTTADDMVSLESLEIQTAKVKKFTKLVEAVCEPELLALMEPLSPHTARVLLLLMSKAGETPPPLALQLIDQISVNQRSALIRALKNIWCLQNCHVKYHWLMELAHYLTPLDDYSWVDGLYDGAQQWNKKLKGKEVDVGLYLIQLMGRLRSTYAWSRLQEIQANPVLWHRRRNYAYLSDASRQVAQLLEQEAKRRDMTVERLADEQMPDFGLADKAGFTVGEEHYQIRLYGDMKLRVINRKGKITKSVSAAKNQVQLAETEAAQKHFKTLQAALKNALKFRHQHLEQALQLGYQWPVAVWQRLFVDHPVMKQAGRTLIWQSDSGQSFRISEDMSLLNEKDDSVSLNESSRIRLWHPANVPPDERSLWKTHFADYELTPWLDQFDIPACIPDANRMSHDQILAWSNLEVPLEAFEKLLRKLRFQVGDFCVWKGWDVYKDHFLNIESENLSVVVHHRGFGELPIFAADAPVSVLGIGVKGLRGENARKAIPPAELKPALQATLFDYLKQIEALAIEEESAAES